MVLIASAALDNGLVTARQIYRHTSFTFDVFREVSARNCSPVPARKLSLDWLVAAGVSCSSANTFNCVPASKRNSGWLGARCTTWLLITWDSLQEVMLYERLTMNALFYLDMSTGESFRNELFAFVVRKRAGSWISGAHVTRDEHNVRARESNGDLNRAWDCLCRKRASCLNIVSTTQRLPYDCVTRRCIPQVARNPACVAAKSPRLN